MMDIERISKDIAERKDDAIAKAFVSQISDLLRENGIVPIMSETSNINSDENSLNYEYGVCFNDLDTSVHDKKIRNEVLRETSETVEKITRLLLEEIDSLRERLKEKES